jgi:hypothetical protein
VGLKLITPPTLWPVSLAAAKQQVRIVHDDDDTLLYNADLSNPGIVQQATLYLQQKWNCAFLSQTWELSIAGWYDPEEWREGAYLKAYRSMFGGRTLIGDILNVGGVGRVGAIYMPRVPLQSVTYIKYFDGNGVLQTLDLTKLDIDTYNKPGRIALQPFEIWPFPQIGKVQDAVRIKFVCGFATVQELAATWPGVIPAIKFLTSHWYMHPEIVGSSPSNEVDYTLAELSGMCNFNVYV